MLDENETWKERVSQIHTGFTNFPALSLFDLFGTIDETVEPFLFLDGGSLPTDLALLRGLARKFGKCSYFEIGTWRGESTANMSPLTTECITMDLPDDQKRAKGMSEEYIGQYAVLSKALPNVNHIKADSQHFDFSSFNRKFDLIFIDGDHHYTSIANDTLNVFAHLVHERSIVVWHDAAYNPERARYEVVAAILDGLDPKLHPNLMYISNTLCTVYFPTPVNPTGDPLKSFKIRLQQSESGS